MPWQDYLNKKNQECYRKSLEDGLYRGDYIQSDIIQTPAGPRPTQHIICCMRCSRPIANRRGTAFGTGKVMASHTELDELKTFPDMRKVRIKVKGVRDGMKVMVCQDCVHPVSHHEDDDRMMFVVVAGHAVFFDQCGRDEKFIKRQVEESEMLEIDVETDR